MTTAALGPVFYTEQNRDSVRYTSVRVSFRDPPPGPWMPGPGRRRPRSHR